MTKEEIIIDSLTKTNKFLKDERDSARRKFCEVAVQPMTYYYTTKEAVAKDHGWDCYDKPNSKDLFITSPCGTYFKWNFATKNWDMV